MNRTILTSALVTSLFVTALASATPGSTGATEPSGTIKPDGTIAVTGITLPGQSVTVPADCEAAADQTAKVVCKAEAFLATLSDEQRAEVVLPQTPANAARWSNLPSPFGERNGIDLSSLNETQLAAAEAVVKAATGTAEGEGYDEAMQIRMADEVLLSFVAGGSAGGQPGSAPDDGASGRAETPPGGAGASGSPDDASGGDEVMLGSYQLAFLGTPSTTGTWMLQFGGHHLAINTTYKAGEVVSATPYHTAVEPTEWTVDGGATYAPLTSDRDAMAAVLASLDDEQLASAKLSETFSDVLLGPGKDGQFPATKEGLAVSSLSDEQKALVLAAMTPWLEDVDAEIAAELMSVYEDELGDTYISFSGNASLSEENDYVRIDGPSVWLEFYCYSAFAFQDGIHYHTVWRDHERDYGAEYSFQ